jgi:hypothetical protein
MIVQKSVKIVVVFHFLNFNHDSFFAILRKNIILEVDIPQFGLKRLFRFDGVRLYVNANNIVDKNLKKTILLVKAFLKKLRYPTKQKAESRVTPSLKK